MKIFFKLFSVIGIIFLTGISCMQVKTPEIKEKIPALDFKLPDLNNEFVTLSSYKGKNPVILLFWTTWCPFCREELNILNKKYPQLAKEGWEVLGINIEESPSIVGVFLKKRPLAFKVLLDTDAQVTYSYDILGVPTFILVNKEGFVVFKDNYFPEDRYKELILK